MLQVLPMACVQKQLAVYIHEQQAFIASKASAGKLRAVLFQVQPPTVVVGMFKQRLGVMEGAFWAPGKRLMPDNPALTEVDNGLKLRGNWWWGGIVGGG